MRQINLSIDYLVYLIKYCIRIYLYLLFLFRQQTFIINGLERRKEKYSHISWFKSDEDNNKHSLVPSEGVLKLQVVWKSHHLKPVKKNVYKL